MSKYSSVGEVATVVNTFFDNLGWDDNGRVIAMSVRKADRSEHARDYDYIMNGYTHELYLVWTTDDDETGETYTGNIMGQVLPAILHEDNTLECLDTEGIDEVFGGGPMLQDVCVGRALEWLGDIDTVIDIEDGWREWPSEDTWFSILQDRDYSSNI